MKEYIEKSAAIHAVLHNSGQAAVAAVQEIKGIEIVTCGECVHYETDGCADGYGWCNDAVVSQGTWDDFYCADGKRKEGAE